MDSSNANQSDLVPITNVQENPDANQSAFVPITNVQENPDANNPDATLPVEIPDLTNAVVEHDPGFGCKFCHLRFSNKQALGGHQNAHKVERAIEKNAREIQERNFYFGNPYRGFLDGSVFNYHYNNPQQQVTQFSYNARPGLPISVNPYGNPYAVPGFNNGYSGWAAPISAGINHQVFIEPDGYVPNYGFNYRFSTAKAGGSSSMLGRAENRDAMNDLDDDAGLDLSLKL